MPVPLSTSADGSQESAVSDTSSFDSVSAPLAPGPANVVDTETRYHLAKPNHSPVFFYDDAWWGVFRSDSDSDWWLWEKTDTGWLQTGLELSSNGSSRPDVVVDPQMGRFFALFSGTSKAEMFSGSQEADKPAPDACPPPETVTLTVSETIMPLMVS